MGKLIYLKGVVTLQLNSDECSGCAMCIAVCPRGVFEIEQRKARIGDRDACIECGACARNCPEGAVFVRVGVGCAAAVVNNMLGTYGSDRCCSLEQYETGERKTSRKGACC